MKPKPLVVVAVVRAKQGRKDELHALLRTLVAPTLREPGCLRYEMNVSEEGTVFVFTEQWMSRPLWDDHMNSEHLGRFKASAEALVENFELFILSEDGAA